MLLLLLPLTPWDNDKEYETTLQTILLEMTPPPVMLQEWCLWHDLEPQQQRQKPPQEEKVEEEPPCHQHNSWVGHWYAARKQLRTIENLLQKAHDDVTHDEQQVQQWQLQVDQCQEAIQILKSELQVKITALFDFEDEIVIVL
jgi:small-conductance mechanosensitive channel